MAILADWTLLGGPLSLDHLPVHGIIIQPKETSQFYAPRRDPFVESWHGEIPAPSYHRSTTWTSENTGPPGYRSHWKKTSSSAKKVYVYDEIVIRTIKPLVQPAVQAGVSPAEEEVSKGRRWLFLAALPVQRRTKSWQENHVWSQTPVLRNHSQRQTRGHFSIMTNFDDTKECLRFIIPRLTDFGWQNNEVLRWAGQGIHGALCQPAQQSNFQEHSDSFGGPWKRGGGGGGGGGERERERDSHLSPSPPPPPSPRPHPSLPPPSGLDEPITFFTWSMAM